MTVIPFPPQAMRGLRSWNQEELESLIAIFGAHASGNGAGSWAIGATELNDPQFYVLGPAPEEECLLTVSRVGGIYVLEDGAGRVLTDNTSLEMVSGWAKAAVPRRNRVSLAGRLLVALGTIRLVLEEKLEPILVEAEELAIRVAPQLAALA
jgi:hypothetical protein